jgi:hypothetical protein
MSTPLQFSNEYYSINVNVTRPTSPLKPLPGILATSTAAPSTVFVRINKYRINAASAYRCDLAEKDVLVAKVRAAMSALHAGSLFGPKQSDLKAIANAFFAKGSPADYAVALRCAALYRGIEPKDLQAYADKHLGIDCSGFVNQYWINEGALSAGSSRTIDVYGRATHRRWAIASEKPADPSAVQPNDMLIWPDFGHITLIDHLSIGKNSAQAVVVESTAHAFQGMSPGLVSTTYELKSVDAKTKKFTVVRGGATVLVYICSFNPVSAK